MVGYARTKYSTLGSQNLDECAEAWGCMAYGLAWLAAAGRGSVLQRYSLLLM